MHTSFCYKNSKSLYKQINTKVSKTRNQRNRKCRIKAWNYRGNEYWSFTCWPTAISIRSFFKFLVHCKHISLCLLKIAMINILACSKNSNMLIWQCVSPYMQLMYRYTSHIVFRLKCQVFPVKINVLGKKGDWECVIDANPSPKWTVQMRFFTYNSLNLFLKAAKHLQSQIGPSRQKTPLPEKEKHLKWFAET